MRRVALAVGVGVVVVVVSAIHAMGTGVTQDDFKTFLAEYEAKAIPLSRASSLAYFIASTSGADSAYERYNALELEYRRLHSDTAAFARIKAFRDGGQVTDSLLRRQLELLYLGYMGNQIAGTLLEQITALETSIEQKFNTYRADVGGRKLSDNTVDSILRASTDSRELEAVWTASKAIGGVVEADLRQLARLRNQAARSVGFADFYEMQLKLTEIEPEELERLFVELDSLTRGAFIELKAQIDSVLSVRLGIPRDQLRPWHYQNRFFQEALSVYDVNLDGFFTGKDPVAIAKAYFAGIGMPVDTILAHSDLYEKPGKYQHAYSTDIDREGDARIVCNIRPDYNWMNTLQHELGHATYSYYNDPSLPWLLRDAAHSLTTEAVALFFGSLAGNPQWLIDETGAQKADVDRVAKACAQSMRAEKLIFSRWSQVMLHFERGLYGNPEQDLNTLWWDLVEKYQLLTRPAGRNQPDWASKIHIATSPVYYHSYLMGELLAAQFAETLRQNVLGRNDPHSASFANDPRIGRFFMDTVYRPGARHPWNEMIARATGSKLSSAAFARQFVSAR
ncbi:MAG: M2 family metallopeptidase [Candidatus Zixiibacteriota bacterium]